MTSRNKSPLSSLSDRALEKLVAEVLREQAQEHALHTGYVPRGAALEVRDHHESEVLLCGPAGTGKTRGILEWIHELCLRYPGIRVLIVRKTRTSLTDSALYTFEEFVLPIGSPMMDGPQRLNRHSYIYPNGSEIVVGGMDKPTRLFSTEYDLVYIPEAIELTLDEFESLKRSLRHFVLPWQQIIADTNPSYPSHWLKQRCDSGTCVLIPSSHKDNPVLWDAAANDWTPNGAKYIKTLDELTGARKQRLRYGLWAQAEGAVYEGFEDSVHVISRDKLPTLVRRWRVIDFGFVNPFVCQWWGMDADANLYLYREIYMTQRTVAVHAQQIIELSKGEAIEATISDHDAEDRATLESYGIVTREAIKDVSPGIQAVQERLKVVEAVKKPRLFVVRDALVEADPWLSEKKKPTSTLEEFAAYVWAQGGDGKPVKEAPLKVYDHGMDAMRYLIMYIDGPALPRPRNLTTVAKRDTSHLPERNAAGLRAMVGGGKKRDKRNLQAA